jgi:hypothetical protein
LIYLDGNSTAYNSYFKWKKHIKTIPHTVNISPICHMCIKAHLEAFYGIEHKTIRPDELDKKFSQSNCKKPLPIEKKFFNLYDL